MATVTSASMGVGAAVTAVSVGAGAAVASARVDGNGLVLDVFPAFFPVTFGVEVDAAVSVAGVG